MVDDAFNSFRLRLMQDVLPVGLALVDRIRKGGANSVVEIFDGSDDPLQELRGEGEGAAKSIREKLDEMSPGLGNPVKPVNVSVDSPSPLEQEIQDEKTLLDVLARIQSCLDLMDSYLENDSIAIKEE